MSHTQGLTALVLAGQRPEGDPMARAAGVAFKALIEIGGVPMLARVVDALRASPSIGRIVIAAQDPAPLLAALDLPPGETLVSGWPAAASPSRTVADVFAAQGAPLLVTTADHPLLTPAMVDAFVAGAPPDADAVAGVARAETVRRELPQTKRTWMRFRDGAYSGCNLFLLATPRAASAIAFWQRIERHRKAPLRMALIVGPVTLLAYLSRRATLAGVLRRLGRTAGARLGFVDLPFARAAVDVDKPADLELVRSLLRATPAATPSSIDPVLESA